jgi:hypothetical protein
MSGTDRLDKSTGYKMAGNLLVSGSYQDIFHLGSNSMYAILLAGSISPTRQLRVQRHVGNDAAKLIRIIYNFANSTTCHFTFDGMFYHTFQYSATAGTYRKLDRDGNVVRSIDTSNFFGLAAPISPKGVAFVENCLVVINGTAISPNMLWLDLSLNIKRQVALTGYQYYNGLCVDSNRFWTNFNDTVTPTYQLRQLDYSCNILKSVTNGASGGKGAFGITQDGISLMTAN